MSDDSGGDFGKSAPKGVPLPKPPQPSPRGVLARPPSGPDPHGGRRESPRRVLVAKKKEPAAAPPPAAQPEMLPPLEEIEPRDKTAVLMAPPVSPNVASPLGDGPPPSVTAASPTYGSGQPTPRGYPDPNWRGQPPPSQSVPQAYGPAPAPQAANDAAMGQRLLEQAQALMQQSQALLARSQQGPAVSPSQNMPHAAMQPPTQPMPHAAARPPSQHLPQAASYPSSQQRLLPPQATPSQGIPHAPAMHHPGMAHGGSQPMPAAHAHGYAPSHSHVPLPSHGHVPASSPYGSPMQGSERQPRPALGPVLISLQNISKSYSRGGETLQILSQLNLEIATGSFEALMGPSGSGKTTLLNLIAGLDVPTGGKVIIEGQDIAAMSEAERAEWRSQKVGFIFQAYNLLPVLTAVQNVEIPLLLTKLSKSERRKRCETALRIVGLEERMNHYPRQLSGGQEQRVAIARAIVNDPTLLVADEPTGDLDRASADAILLLLEKLNAELGKTIVMVTHDDLAARRARILHRLDKGALVS